LRWESRILKVEGEDRIAKALTERADRRGEGIGGVKVE
jgi:hypothetical protein